MHPTESTDRLITALGQVRKIDLDKLFLSGIDIQIGVYRDADRVHMDRVTIHAEDAAPVRDAIEAAIAAALERRRESLKRQLIGISEVIGV